MARWVFLLSPSSGESQGPSFPRGQVLVALSQRGVCSVSPVQPPDVATHWTLPVPDGDRIMAVRMTVVGARVGVIGRNGAVTSHWIDTVPPGGQVVMRVEGAVGISLV